MDRCRSQIINSIKKCRFSDSDSKSHDHANKNMNENSNSTESCKVISNLPDDLMFDILTFVPVNCLINSARYVCKLWAATISSSRFAEAHERRARSKHGLYVESFMLGKSSYFMEFKDDVNGQYERIDLEIPRRMGQIIGTCDGIILLLSYLSTQMFVVNPILKCWRRIPPFPSSQRHIDVSRQCTIARVPRTSKFKLFLVVVLEISDVVWYVFYVLRIGIDNSWEEITRKETPHNKQEFWKTIYSGGNNLYLITNHEVIMMDVDKEIIVREYPLPIALELSFLVPRFFSTGNCLFCIDSEIFYRTYKILILDFDSGKWSLYHEMGPFDYIAACGQNLHAYSVEFCFWINDQIIFQVDRQYFGYNVKTKKLTKIKGMPDGRSKAWLHTNSLVSLSTTPT